MFIEKDIRGERGGLNQKTLKANSGVRISVGREAYYAQTGIYVWCKYNSDIKASKSFKLNWNFVYAKCVFFSKIKHANHPNLSVTTGNHAKTKCFPFCISTIQYQSLRFEAIEGVNEGFWGADQPLMNMQIICDIIVACLFDFPCISY